MSAHNNRLRQFEKEGWWWWRGSFVFKNLAEMLELLSLHGTQERHQKALHGSESMLKSLSSCLNNYLRRIYIQVA
jgi:hypothetical protein